MNCGFKCGLNSFGLLLMRVTTAAMMVFGHGLGKMQNYSDLVKVFKGPFGMSSQVSLTLAIVGEVVAPVLVAVGLLTRFSTLFVVATMAVAAFWAHADDPLFSTGGPAKEMAILYLIPFATLLFTGPGKIAIDALLFREKKDVVVKV